MESGNKEQDKAGQEYWNQTWDYYSFPKAWDVDSKRLSNHVEREFFLWIASTLEGLGKIGLGVRLVEVGCARSQALPVLARRLGVSVAGIDYSPNGCKQIREMLKREGVSGEVYCSDIFAVPATPQGNFDAAATERVAPIQLAYFVQLPFMLIIWLGAKVMAALNLNGLLSLYTALGVLLQALLAYALAARHGLPGIAWATVIVSALLAIAYLTARRSLRHLSR